MTQQNGRNAYDAIVENPWKVFMLILTILLIVLFLASRSVPIKIGSIQIGKTEVYIHDTVIKTKYDTVYIQQNNEQLNAKNNAIKVQSFNQKGGQTANEIDNR
jgi:uncharacterized protein YxeA